MYCIACSRKRGDKGQDESDEGQYPGMANTKDDCCAFPQTYTTTKDIRASQVHILFVQSFKSHEQGTTESKKHDHKHHAKTTHVSINRLGQCSGVQTSGTTEKREKACTSKSIKRKLPSSFFPEAQLIVLKMVPAFDSKGELLWWPFKLKLLTNKFSCMWCCLSCCKTQGSFSTLFHKIQICNRGKNSIRH